MTWCLTELQVRRLGREAPEFTPCLAAGRSHRWTTVTLRWVPPKMTTLSDSEESNKQRIADASQFICDQLEDFRMNLQRSEMLVKLYESISKSYPEAKSVLATDILRAAVVFLHASLEELLRSISTAVFPYSDERTLNEVPLAGLNKHARPEKFYLGELTRFRGKSVDEVLALSVKGHISRQTYNNRGDLLAFARAVGLEEAHLRGCLPSLDAMLFRRHQIVHRADRPIEEDQKRLRATSLSPRHVRAWISATKHFVAAAMTGALITKFVKSPKKSVGPRKHVA